jgi:exonuclease SbcC
MTIKSLHIVDFQSHKNSIIEFSKNTTAIIGLNNFGKSAVLKALRKLVRNEPNGNSFVRNIPEQTDASSIKLNMDNADTVERRVGVTAKPTDNMYKVNLSSGDHFEFTKFHKTGIPEEVINTLGISLPQLFGDVEFD